MVEIGDWVEWSFGGLATIQAGPIRKYKQDWMRILPVNTGDPSTGTGYTRLWPLRQLKVADMNQWHYDPRSNSHSRRDIIA